MFVMLLTSRGGQLAEKKDIIVIKKYANRRLYNTATSSYVTLENLLKLVKDDVDFEVKDAKTGKDLTHSILTQIIVDEEAKGQSLLPTNFLKQLIRFYGKDMHQFVPGYLELSLESLTRQQDRYREQFGNSAFVTMQSQTRQNLAMFERSLAMFNPFTIPGMENPEELDAETGDTANAPANGHANKSRDGSAGVVKKESKDADELSNLQTQMAEMQKQLNKIAKK